MIVYLPVLERSMYLILDMLLMFSLVSILYMVLDKQLFSNKILIQIYKIILDFKLNKWQTLNTYDKQKQKQDKHQIRSIFSRPRKF